MEPSVQTSRRLPGMTDLLEEQVELLDATQRSETQLLQLGRGHAALGTGLRNLDAALERLASGSAGEDHY